ncbi:MAG TPA: hypothetical protein VNW92_31780, partial [Polyangiaceae bacterium]|nr:hypothetical protein [Polyangiaceae bacterium]
PNTNGECDQDFECKCEIANNAPGHSINASFTTAGGETLSFPDGLLPGECGDGDKCTASDWTRTGAEIVDDYRIKQFNAMCGAKYVRDSLLTNKKKQYDSLSPAGKAVWKMTNDYCNAVQDQIDAHGGTPVGIQLSGSLLATERDLVNKWKSAGLGPSDAKIFQAQWGTGSNATHTEPKAIALIRDWAEGNSNGDQKAFLNGGTFTLTPRAGGTASPCDKCDLDLTEFAKQYGVTINYTFTSIYGTGIRAKNADAKSKWFWPPSTTCKDPKPGNSLKLDGTITYAPSTGTKTFSTPALPICCQGP